MTAEKLKLKSIINYSVYGTTKIQNQTFSLPEEIATDLHSLVKRREMSRFVADAICKALET